MLHWQPPEFYCRRSEEMMCWQASTTTTPIAPSWSLDCCHESRCSWVLNSAKLCLTHACVNLSHSPKPRHKLECMHILMQNQNPTMTTPAYWLASLSMHLNLSLFRSSKSKDSTLPAIKTLSLWMPALCLTFFPSSTHHISLRSQITSILTILTILH